MPLLIIIFFVAFLASGISPCFAAEKPAPGGPQPSAAAPPLPSPVDSFRMLLRMSSAEREKFLASKSPEKRQVVEVKLREYESLTPEERETRLRALSLRAWVQQLMPVPASNRVERLARLPDDDRKIVQERLTEWDALPADLRQQVLTNRTIIVILANPGRVRALPPHPADPKQRQLARELAQWDLIPQARRKDILEQFHKFFDELDVKQRREVLDSFSQAERMRMQRSLQAFERLPRDKRERCLAGFRKFAGLSSSEREEFLQNAQRWQDMSPQDRQLWRALVAHLAPSTPPMPPGAPQSSRPLPPAPPKPTARLLSNTN